MSGDSSGFLRKTAQDGILHLELIFIFYQL